MKFPQARAQYGGTCTYRTYRDRVYRGWPAMMAAKIPTQPPGGDNRKGSRFVKTVKKKWEQ